MELDDFKKKYKKNMDYIKADDIGTDERIDDMINLFKSYEKNQRKKVLYFIIINFLFAVVYITNMAAQKGLTALGYSILAAGLIGAVLYFLLRYRPLSPKSYALPLREFVERAERKIKYLNSVDYIILIPLLLLLGTGGGMVFTTRLLRYTDNSTLLIILWVLFFVSLCIFGFWAGKKIWQKEYGDIYDRIMKMKNY
ncbi:MAG: hypothetical protein HPY62_02275 [Bacteroidales bacterium]|nr:hypothetical protein [Bacteroidales bacterium]